MDRNDLIDLAIRTSLPTPEGEVSTETSTELAQLFDYEQLRDRAERALKQNDLLTPTDNAWPLSAGSGVPALWVRGGVDRLQDLVADSVVITGSRVVTSYGTEVATDLTRAAVAAGVTPMNAGGFGVDGAVLRTCVADQQPAIIVVAGDPDRPFPHSHTELFQQVLDLGGVIVSAYGPGVPPSRSWFLARARMMSWLATRGSVIVESSARSGCLETARQTKQLGRNLYAVPGPITSAASYGTNDLLSTGDALAVSSADWLKSELTR